MTPAIPNPREGAGTPPALPVPPRAIPLWAWIVAAAGVAFLGFLWRVEPAGQAFFPRCWLYQTTGLQCPGCGATRAVHALLNGQFREAFHLNALVVLALPLVGGLAVRFGWGWRTGRWWPNPLAHPMILALLTGLACGFGVGRNLGW